MFQVVSEFLHPPSCGIGRQLMFLIFNRLSLCYLFLFGCNHYISYDFVRSNIATKLGKNDQIKIIKTIAVWKMKER